ncbi:MAG: patatin-like phospholipase family protein [Acidobacteria bacterium]|nr:patatin-like phospholipase family protein [Acidobacteriota bacterium]
MLPRQPEQDAVFRVLALDGGGARGLFTASFLATLEDLLRVRIADQFDLIVGTSSGATIGLALAFGLPAQRVLDLFLAHGERIFSRPRRLGMLLRPKYDGASLARALREVFGERRINEVLTAVCVASYELTNSYPRIWKDDHAPDMRCGGDEPAWRIALASSAAPIYFPGSRVIDDDSHVDGGLFANNPILIGLAEAVRYFDRPLDRIRILSVGTGERAERIPHDRARRMGVWGWKTLLYEHMLIAQARIAHEVARRLLSPGQYERVNVPLEHRYPIDDFEAARVLVEPGAQAARTRLSDLKHRFLFGLGDDGPGAEEERRGRRPPGRRRGETPPARAVAAPATSSATLSHPLIRRLICVWYRTPPEPAVEGVQKRLRGFAPMSSRPCGLPLSARRYGSGASRSHGSSTAAPAATTMRGAHSRATTGGGWTPSS